MEEIKARTISGSVNGTGYAIRVEDGNTKTCWANGKELPIENVTHEPKRRIAGG